MKSPISDKINGGDIRIKKKKVIRSPLSEKYQRFLNHENINLEHTKSKPIEDIKINVIKKGKEEKEGKKEEKEGKKEGKEGKRKPCKRKRVKMKHGKLDQKVIEHNKKCEEQINPIINVESPKKKVKKVKKNKKSKRRKLSQRHTRGRRISLKNSSKKKKGKNIDHEIQSAKRMSDDKIKEELLKSGIIIKGNQKQLMRDIYVFSNLGGINIRKE